MRDGQLLEKQEIDKMYDCVILHILIPLLTCTCPSFSRHIPTIVVQGRYDVVCPVRIYLIEEIRR